MESVKCNLCGSDDPQIIYRVRDTNYGTPGEFTIVQCRQCKLAYLNLRPTATELSAAYVEESYDPFKSSLASTDPKPDPLQKERARTLTRWCDKRRLLDVGCGDGRFLLAMREAGWECTGIEPNARMAEYGRLRVHLDVRQGDIFTVGETESFDLVTLWDVLEHTPSPRHVLLHANHLLTPGGRIALSLPNWDSFERRIFHERWIALDTPRHLYHFSPRTVRRMLALCGFDVELLRARAPVLSLASNVLRLLGDLLFRRGQSTSPKIARRSMHNTTPSLPRRTLIQLTHLSMTPVNALANRFNRGASLTIIARKKSGLLSSRP